MKHLFWSCISSSSQLPHHKVAQGWGPLHLFFCKPYLLPCQIRPLDPFHFLCQLLLVVPWELHQAAERERERERLLWFLTQFFYLFGVRTWIEPLQPHFDLKQFHDAFILKTWHTMDIRRQAAPEVYNWRNNYDQHNQILRCDMWQLTHPFGCRHWGSTPQ